MTYSGSYGKWLNPLRLERVLTGPSYCSDLSSDRLYGTLRAQQTHTNGRKVLVPWTFLVGLTQPFTRTQIRGTPVMVAAIYARKSTDRGAVADEAKSVTRQIEHATAYAARHGWTVPEASVFVDDGISGAEFANRPGFVRLMASLKAPAAVSGADHVGEVTART
jgi:hypothetical protein